MRFDLELHAVPRDGELELYWVYNRDLFDRERVESWARHFAHLVDAIIASPERPLRELEILDAFERHALIEGYNQTAREVRSRTLPGLFEECVASDPARLAVLDSEGGLTYGELNARANQLAHHLIGQGVRPGARVGLCLEHSIELVVAMLAVVKTGAAYVPMEPAWPKARIDFICVDTGTTVLLTDTAVPEGMPCSDPGIAVDPDDLAYIIFTLGSTGTPKGVALQHRPVVNLIDWVNRRYHVNGEDRLLFVTSPCFDLSVYDVFGTLASGASVYVASPAELKDPEVLIRVIGSAGITFWDSAPAFLQQLVPFLASTPEADTRLRLIFASGDWIPLSLPTRLRLAYPGVEFVGLGGATEAAIWSNWFDVEEVRPEWNSIPYGLPIQNGRYYILDADLNPSPFGVSGDLYIGGKCLSLGYYNRAELTAERFVPDPYGGGEARSCTPRGIARGGWRTATSSFWAGWTSR